MTQIAAAGPRRLVLNHCRAHLLEDGSFGPFALTALVLLAEVAGGL